MSKHIDIDFERVSIVCTLVRLAKTENILFCPGGLSYVIQEKFTAWWVNSPLISLETFSSEI